MTLSEGTGQVDITKQTHGDRQPLNHIHTYGQFKVTDQPLQVHVFGLEPGYPEEDMHTPHRVTPGLNPRPQNMSKMVFCFGSDAAALFCGQHSLLQLAFTVNIY